jgi:hypothetical protein
MADKLMDGLALAVLVGPGVAISIYMLWGFGKIFFEYLRDLKKSS